MKTKNQLPLLLADDLSQEPGNEIRSIAIIAIVTQLAQKLKTSIDLV